MPRIDPLRLLSTLKPLLNPETGGIRSEKEVDKIFVLMTKYSKKLVSKCTYLNIIGATSTDVRDVFMDRGGWDMLNSWTVEAKSTKNHVLLNEIIKLLLNTPASVSRLRINSLPKEIKFISNKWDNEGTKVLAEKLVAHWIAVAKKEEQGAAQLAAVPGCAVSQIANNASVLTGSVPSSIADTSAAASSAFVMQDLGPMTDESLNATHLLTDSTIYDSEVQPSMDLDMDCINNVDLSEIMDFNPDLFTTTIDQHLGELNATANAAAAAHAAVPTITNEHPQQLVTGNATSFSVPPQQQQQQLQQLQAVVAEKMDTIPSSEAPTVPPILIKKQSGGQCSVITAEQPADQQPGRERFCIINHNGQRLLMRVQVADSNNVPAPVQQQQSNQAQATQDQQVTSTVVVVDSSSSPSTVVSSASPSPEKKKRPRKDPSIAAMRNENKVPSEQPRILKTYSKKTNAELEKKVTTDGVPEKDTKATAAKSASESSKSSSSSSKSSSSSSKSRSSSSSKSSKSSASSAAAKAAEEAAAEKLRLKVKEQKKKLKEREEAKKKEENKQKQKDDQTLKEIYGASIATAPSSVKIPKKPSKPSFTDLIGVPGSTDEGKKEKITKEKTSKSGATKDESKDSITDEDSLQDVTGFGAFTRSESKDMGPSKEGKRNTTVRVYQTAKSKSMDLLETMTKGSSSASTKGKNKVDLDSKDSSTSKIEGGSSKPEKPKNSLSFEDALAGAGAAIKPAKRPSLDGSTKSGDAKKPKLDDSAEKDLKKKSKEDKKKESSRSSSDKKKSSGIQESSLFMDALCATREPSKAKRKRRLSSSADSKELPGSSNNNGIASIPATSPAATTKPVPTEEQPVVKPMFNFYRDTLNDDDEEDEKPKGKAEQVSMPDNDEEAPESTPVEPTETTNDIKDELMDDAFAPAEGEGKLKSCLCIHRDKTKPKKGVRFREDDELKEFHFFEMDETERINVTKQPKNFMEMKLMERSEEKLCIRRKLSGMPPPEEKMPWVLRLIHPSSMATFQEVKSVEKGVQEERERGILETFYFPGAALPDHPSEGDFLYAEVDPNHLARSIPLDDVPVLTKFTDWSAEPWPLPQGIPGRKMPMRSNHVPTPIPANPLNPTNAFVNAFGAAAPTPVPAPAAANVDFSNPWTTPFANIPVAPVNPNPDPWTAAAAAPDVPGFGAFGAVPNPQVNAFAMPFGFPFPGVGQIGAVPPVQIPPGGIAGFGAGPANQFDQDSNNSGPGRPRGDVDYRDMRRHNNERERGGRNRDNNRPGRGGERDRDRDRDNIRDNRRDRDRHDNNRDRDYRDRRRPGGRRNTMCSFFAKGYCREGNKCSFLHPGVNGPLGDDSNNSGNNFSRHNSKSNSPPCSGGNGNSDRRRSPPTRDSFVNSNLHNSPTSSATASSSSGSSGPYTNNGSNNNDRHHPHDDNPGIESPTPETETRYTPPSSPSENNSVGATEHVKVIPTFTEEDWG